MTQKTLLAAASLALFATAPMVYADAQLYGKLGANLSSSSKIVSPLETYRANTGILPEATLGYDFDNGFAVELSYQQLGGGIKNATIGGVTTATTAGNLIFESTMVKGIYHIPVAKSAHYNPYVGLGLGSTSIKLDKLMSAGLTSALNADGTTARAQLTLGNRFEFDQGWFGDLALNYTHISAATLTNRANNVTQKFGASQVTSISFAVGKSF